VSGRDAKLARLVDRLVAAESGALTVTGREFMRQLLRWRLGLCATEPHLPSRGRPLDVVRYERQIIDTRVARALEQPGVAEETEAAGAVVR
jgi:hypothetical protein